MSEHAQALCHEQVSTAAVMSAAVSRGPSLAGQGQLAVSRIAGEDDSATMVRELRRLQRQLFVDAKAEYGAALQIEAQAEGSSLSGLVEAGATLRNHLPRVLGGTDAPRPVADDHRGWQHVLALLESMDAAISTHQLAHAVELLKDAATALRDEKLRRRATLARIEAGGEACIAGLEVIIGICVTVGSAGVGSSLAASGASLLRVAAYSATTAAVSRTVFTGAKVASERMHGIDEDSWLSSLLDGGEEGVTTLVFAFVGGKLAARFVPRLARFLGEHVTPEALLRIGKIMHLAGPAPRDFFVNGGAKLVWELVAGAGGAILAAPIHAACEALRGHHATVERTIQGTLEQMLKGAAFQLVMSGLLHLATHRSVGGWKPVTTEGLNPAAAEKARFDELLANDGIQNKREHLAQQLAWKRMDPELASLLNGICDDELLAVIGYTGDDYKVINLALRMGNAQFLAAMKPYIELATRGLGRMPVHQGKVWRGVKHMAPDALARYQVGATVTEDGFTSTSTKPETKFEGAVHMEIESASAHEISQLSIFKAENEALFAPGAEFLVRGRFVDAEGRTQLRLSEVTK